LRIDTVASNEQGDINFSYSGKRGGGGQTTRGVQEQKWGKQTAPVPSWGFMLAWAKGRGKSLGVERTGRRGIGGWGKLPIKEKHSNKGGGGNQVKNGGKDWFLGAKILGERDVSKRGHPWGWEKTFKPVRHVHNRRRPKNNKKKEGKKRNGFVKKKGCKKEQKFSGGKGGGFRIGIGGFFAKKQVGLQKGGGLVLGQIFLEKKTDFWGGGGEVGIKKVHERGGGEKKTAPWGQFNHLTLAREGLGNEREK